MTIDFAMSLLQSASFFFFNVTRVRTRLCSRQRCTANRCADFYWPLIFLSDQAPTRSSVSDVAGVSQLMHPLRTPVQRIFQTLLKRPEAKE